MGSRPLGGYVGYTPVPAPSDSNSQALGIWTLHQAFAQIKGQAWPTAGSDPDFSSVQLLLKFNNTGSTFLDSSSAARSVTAVGGATHSTLYSRFGGISGLFNGSGSYVTTSASAFDFSTSNFAVEWWQLILDASLSGASSQVGVWSNGRRSGQTEGIACYMQHTGGNVNKFQMDCHIGGSWTSPFLLSSTNYTSGVWQHMAISRSGTTYRLFLAGTQVATATNSGTLQWPNLASAAVGSASGAGEFASSGRNIYIDDFRVTIGSDRGYTGSTITVPSVGFPSY